MLTPPNVHSRAVTNYSILLTIVGWASMAAYSIPDYLNRVPPLISPPEGISMDWVTFRNMRVRCAVVTSQFLHVYRLKIPEDHLSPEGSGEYQAFLTAGFARRSFGMGSLPGHAKVRWSKLDVPVRGTITAPSGWNHIDIWIVQPSFFMN